MLFLALVFSSQIKKKYIVKAWTEVSKESSGVFFCTLKGTSLPKNVSNPYQSIVHFKHARKWIQLLLAAQYI